MSERKTAEIKLRVTPSFKAHLRELCAASDEDMTEYIEKAVEQREATERVWAEANKHLDGTLLIDNTISILADEPEPAETVLSVDGLLDVDTVAVLAEEKRAEAVVESAYPWMFRG